MKSHNAHYSERDLSHICLMCMNMGHASSMNHLPTSRIEPALYMLKKQHDEQNIIAGSDVEFADLRSCRQIARADGKQNSARLSGPDWIPFRCKEVSRHHSGLCSEYRHARPASRSRSPASTSTFSSTNGISRLAVLFDGCFRKSGVVLMLIHWLHGKRFLARS